MERIMNYGMLQQAIRTLEIEQSEKWQHVKAQFSTSNMGLKPSGLLKGTLMEMITSPYVINKTVGTAVGLASGYLLEKLVVGATTTLFRKLFGSVLRIGTATLFNKRHSPVKTS